MDRFESLFEDLEGIDWEANAPTPAEPPLNEEQLRYSSDMSGLDEMMNVPPPLSPIRDPEPPALPNYEPPSSDEDDAKPSPNHFEPNYEPASPAYSSSDDDAKQPPSTTKAETRRGPITPPGSPHFEPSSPKVETRTSPKAKTRRGPITPPGSPHFESSPNAETSKRRGSITPPASPHVTSSSAETKKSETTKTPRKEPRLSLKRKISPIRAPAGSAKKSFTKRPPKDPRLEKKTLKLPKFTAKGIKEEMPKDKQEVPKPQQSRRPDEKIVSRIPWKPHHSYKPQRRKLHWHTVNYVLAIREGEYVLTNGYKALDVMCKERWLHELKKDLQYACTYSRSLYCVDNITYQRLKQAMDTWPLDHSIYSVAIRVWNDVPPLGPCTYCMNPECVKWLAIRGGIQRFFRYEVDMVIH